MWMRERLRRSNERTLAHERLRYACNLFFHLYHLPTISRWDMVFVKSITCYLLPHVSSTLDEWWERATTGANRRGTGQGKTRRAKDRGRRIHSYQRGTLVKIPTKKMENLSQEISRTPRIPHSLTNSICYPR